MKHYLIPTLLLSSILFFACNSSKKLYEAKEYDQVIQKEAPKICSGRLSKDAIDMVASAYHQANQRDHERIMKLKASGQPDVWPEIYQRYCSMKGRNEALSCFPAKIKKEINFVTLNLDEDIATARNKAETYLVAKINQLLGNNNKADAIEAEELTVQLKKTNPSNPNIYDFRTRAMTKAADAILVGCSLKDKDRYPLPKEIMAEVLRFDAGELEGCRAAVDIKNDRSKDYDLVLDVEIASYAIGPDRDETATFQEGAAKVTDHVLSKNATLKGVIHYVGSRTGLTVPFEVTSNFRHTYTTVEGDKSSCSAQTLERLNTQAVPFPSDMSMLDDAARQLNNLIAEGLRQ